MKSLEPEEARQIVDAFISAYMAVEVTSKHQKQNSDLTFLENEQNKWRLDMDDKKRKIGLRLEEKTADKGRGKVNN